MKCAAFRWCLAALLVGLSTFSTAALADLSITSTSYVGYNSENNAEDACESASPNGRCQSYGYRNSGWFYYNVDYSIDDAGHAQGEQYQFHYSTSGSCPSGQQADSDGLCSAPQKVCDTSLHKLTFTDKSKFDDANDISKGSGVAMPNGDVYQWQFATYGQAASGEFHGSVYVKQDCSDNPASKGVEIPSQTISDSNDSSSCFNNKNGKTVCASADAAQNSRASCKGAFGQVDGHDTCIDNPPTSPSQCATSSDGSKACYGQPPTVFDAQGQPVYPDFQADAPTSGDSSGSSGSNSISEDVYAPSTTSSVSFQTGDGPDFGAPNGRIDGGSYSSSPDGSGGSASDGGDGSGNSMSCVPGSSGCPLKLDGRGLSKLGDHGGRYDSISNNMTSQIAAQLHQTDLPSSFPTGKSLVDRIKAMIPSGSSCTTVSIEVFKGHVWTFPGADGCKAFTTARNVFGWALAVLAILEIQEIFFTSARRK